MSQATAIGRRVSRGQARPGGASQGVNVNEWERLASVAAGGLLAFTGLSRGNSMGLLTAALGGALMYRGLSGHCHMYGAMGLSTAEEYGHVASVAAGHGVKVLDAVTINAPAADLYRFWRNFENLPRIMRHLKSVTVTGDRSHWVARAPLGMSVSWDAEIVNDRPNELIAWRSIEGSMVDTAGSVHFRPAPGNRGTEVHINLKYDPPGGQVGSTLAWLFGEEPTLQIREDLLRLKQLMEAGEIATIEGQPSGRR